MLDTIAQRLDIGMAVDLGESVMHIVAVLLDGGTVRSVLDRGEFLQNVGKLAVGVGYAEYDKAFVQWRQMVRRASRRKDTSVRRMHCTLHD